MSLALFAGNSTQSYTPNYCIMGEKPVVQYCKPNSIVQDYIKSAKCFEGLRSRAEIMDDDYKALQCTVESGEFGVNDRLNGHFPLTSLIVFNIPAPKAPILELFLKNGAAAHLHTKERWANNFTPLESVVYFNAPGQEKCVLARMLMAKGAVITDEGKEWGLDNGLKQILDDKNQKCFPNAENV